MAELFNILNDRKASTEKTEIFDSHRIMTLRQYRPINSKLNITDKKNL